MAVGCVYRQGITEQDHVACLSDAVLQEVVSCDACESCPFHTTTKREPLPTVPAGRKGFGDLVADALAAVGIEKTEDCRCGSRQAKLNRWWPFDASRIDPRWAVAVTTAPRAETTLTQCVGSLRQAGWEPIIFAEPNSHKIADAETIWNKQKRGVWHNWLNSAKWCLSKTKADWILTVQDDVVFHPDSKTFAESLLWPSERAGYLSLYCPKHYQLKHDDPTRWGPGVRRIITRSMWGACALIWPREVLREVVNHKIARRWKGVLPQGDHKAEVRAERKADPSKIKNSDTAIGRIMRATQREMWYVDPSPAQHVARYSSVNHGGNRGRRNCHRCADFGQPLAEQVPWNGKTVKVQHG